MSANGSWTIKITAPDMPAQAGAFEFTSSGGRLDGVSTVLGFAPLPISEGRVTGDDLDFVVRITDPAPMTVRFTLTVADDQLTGVATVPGFPDGAVTGHRDGGR